MLKIFLANIVCCTEKYTVSTLYMATFEPTNHRLHSYTTKQKVEPKSRLLPAWRFSKTHRSYYSTFISSWLNNHVHFGFIVQKIELRTLRLPITGILSNRNHGYNSTYVDLAGRSVSSLPLYPTAKSQINAYRS